MVWRTGFEILVWCLGLGRLGSAAKRLGGCGQRTLNLNRETSSSTLTLNPKPQTINPKLNTKLQTFSRKLDPKPQSHPNLSAGCKPHIGDKPDEHVGQNIQGPGEDSPPLNPEPLQPKQPSDLQHPYLNSKSR